MNMKLTPFERQAIQGIKDSDYYTGPDSPVWSWSANNFKIAAQFSGVISSLVKKGFVSSNGTGDDAEIALTKAGIEASK